MKPALQLRVGQQLSLTPQLKQAIRLLAMSTLELQTELTLAVSTNPMLDWDEGEGAPEADVAPDGEEARIEEAVAEDSGEAAELDLDRATPESAMPARPDDDDGSDEVQTAEVPDLTAHLLWQLRLSRLPDRDLAIAIAIVESLDEDGYLHEDDASLARMVDAAHPPPEDLVAAVRHFVQRLDPVGVASRNLVDCLRVQLLQYERDAARDLAVAIVESHLPLLARHDRTRLARELGAGEAALDEAIALIRTLDPRPGARFARVDEELIVPDVHVRKRHGQWEVALNDAQMPRVRLNEHYARLLRGLGRDEGGPLRAQLQEARWLLKSLEQRDQTVLKVARVIVERQQDFLERGPEAMRPLVMREVAEEIGMHESTVSRVTTRKYLRTPRGTYEFKHFFSSHVATRDGGEASSTAIQAMIRKLIEAEDAARPLSDSALSAALKRQGILVARRTVAKYREALRIPSSTERTRQS